MRTWAGRRHRRNGHEFGDPRRAVGIVRIVATLCVMGTTTVAVRAQCQLQHVLPSSTTPGAMFGWSIGATEECAVIGAPYGTAQEFGDGVAFAYRRTGQQWIQTGMLIASNGAFGDYFGGAVAIDGEHLLIAAPAAQHGSSLGSVYAFSHQGHGVWTQQAIIDPLPTETLDHFGASLALHEDTAIIGAFRNDHGKLFGKAFVYRYTGGAWQREAMLVPTDHPQALIGWSVAIQNDQALIGAISTTNDPAGYGAAFVFERSSGGLWTHTATLAPQAIAADVGYGCAVALSSLGGGGGRTAVIGAYRDSDPGHDSGSAYVFHKPDGGQWSEQQRIVAPNGASHDYFGFSLAVRENQLLVGAYQHDSNGGAKVDAGQAYIFHGEPDGTWRPAGSLIGGHVAPADQFGWAVAFAGDMALIGATGADDHAQDAGSAFAFAVDGSDCNGNGQIDACDIAGGFSADADLDGVPDECVSPPVCAADIAPPGATDGEVGIDDMLLVLSAWGTADPIADIDGSGTVGIDDLLLVLGAWGPCE